MTIICADPSPISLFRLDKMVKKIAPDAEVLLCKKADSAILTAKKSGCDVLITEIDFGRKKGEGIVLAEKIRSMISSANIIFATAEPNRDYAALIVKMKYSGYLTKPFGVEELRKELQELRYH